MFSAFGDEKMGQNTLFFQYVISFARLRSSLAKGQNVMKKSEAI
jgi:hypothetical protein